MPMFIATVRTTHEETWSVEAEDEEEARKMIDDLDPTVDTDETGGEIVDWEVKSIKEMED